MEKVYLNKVVEFKKIFSPEDVQGFAVVSEDDNPIHLDEKYAAESIFKGRIVHGVLLVSMFSKIFGTVYPGNGSIYMSQTSKFLRPVLVDTNVTSRVTLISFDNVKKQGIFQTECYTDADVLAVTGEAKILFPSNFELQYES